MMIARNYGYRPQLPAIMGTEGAGGVIAEGAGVKHLKEGDRLLLPFPHPAWAVIRLHIHPLGHAKEE
jgi:NADPH:quinone reductase-like Zn-dependent oxidoreductase